MRAFAATLRKGVHISTNLGKRRSNPKKRNLIPIALFDQEKGQSPEERKRMV